MIRTNIHLSEIQLEQLKRLSIELDRPYSELVRIAVDNLIKEQQERERATSQ